jgi:hypothetical protein
MIEQPGNDNTHPTGGKRPATAALFLISAIIVVLVLIRHDSGVPTVLPAETAAQTVPAAPAQNDGAIDTAAIAAWEKIAAKNGLDPAQFIAVYLQDTRAITVILSGKDTPEIPAYEITLERGSHRVMGFVKIP